MAGRLWPARVGALLLLACLGLGAWRFTQLGAAGVRELFEAAGVWAPVAYVISFALLEPFGVLGILFIGPGSLIWPWWELFLYTWLGATGASAVGFWFARTLGRDWVARRIPTRLLAYEERLARNALLGVILLRLVFSIWPPVHWMLGLSRVHFGPYLLGSAIGLAPGMAILTWVGQSLLERALSLSPEAAIALGIGAVTIFLAVRWWRLRRAGSAA